MATHYMLGDDAACGLKGRQIRARGEGMAPWNVWGNSNPYHADMCPECRAELLAVEEESEADDESDWLATECRVAVCYSIVTQESAAIGDAAEHGTESDEATDFEGAIRQLESCVELSAAPIRRPEDCRGVWAIREATTDHQTGDDRTETVHVTRENGAPLPDSDLFELYRRAGLIAK